MALLQLPLRVGISQVCRLSTQAMKYAPVIEHAPALDHQAIKHACQATTQGQSRGIGYRPGDLVPSMAALIPEVCRTETATNTNWVKDASVFFQMWHKLGPCMPLYEKFLKAHKGPPELGKGFESDRNTVRHILAGRTMSEEVKVALAEFYLAVALKLRPEEMAAAGNDSQVLLKVAESCANNDFETFVENARNLVSDYDADLHRSLEETCPLYEVDDGLFWRANFEIAAPAEFQHFLTAAGHGSGKGWVNINGHTSPKEVPKQVALARQGLTAGDPAFEPARRASELVYKKWLQASSMPVKATISRILMEYGLLVSLDVYESGKLLPTTPDVANVSSVSA